MSAPGQRPADVGPPPGARRPGRGWALAAAVVIAVTLVGAGVAVVLATQDQANPAAEPLRAYVDSVEPLLVRSHAARAVVAHAVASARRCATTPAQAAAAIGRVRRERERIVRQVARVHAPPEGTDALARLQRAEEATIAADVSLADWFGGRRGCLGDTPLPAHVTAAQALAASYTRDFVDGYDPLARRYGGRSWSATEL